MHDMNGAAPLGARGLRLPLLLLWPLLPLLWLQARYVRRVTPRMPEPPGSREGTAGSGPLIRLLVAGDSGAAGVGAPTQDQALCGQLVRCLSLHHTVEWCVLAVKGLDSPGLITLLQKAPCPACTPARPCPSRCGGSWATGPGR